MAAQHDSRSAPAWCRPARERSAVKSAGVRPRDAPKNAGAIARSTARWLFRSDRSLLTGRVGLLRILTSGLLAESFDHVVDPLLRRKLCAVEKPIAHERPDSDVVRTHPAFDFDAVQDHAPDRPLTRKRALSDVKDGGKR